MSKLTDEQILEDERLCDEATDGPWEALYSMLEDDINTLADFAMPNDGRKPIGDKKAYANAAFAARARTALPQYIAEVKELRKKLALYKRQFELEEAECDMLRKENEALKAQVEEMKPGWALTQIRAGNVKYGPYMKEDK